ncbi:hypothetical protein PM082_004097 [Marasmius tenuissimus]|nr:hypothetical protein PM082_004097 [Marasmius tenuissimus]
MSSCDIWYKIVGVLSLFGRAAVIVNTLLSILMVLFELSSAVLTIGQGIHTFRGNGPWREQKQDMMYLLFQQGK